MLKLQAQSCQPPFAAEGGSGAAMKMPNPGSGMQESEGQRQDPRLVVHNPVAAADADSTREIKVTVSCLKKLISNFMIFLPKGTAPILLIDLYDGLGLTKMSQGLSTAALTRNIYASEPAWQHEVAQAKWLLTYLFIPGSTTPQHISIHVVETPCIGSRWTRSSTAEQVPNKGGGRASTDGQARAEEEAAVHPEASADTNDTDAAEGKGCTWDVLSSGSEDRLVEELAAQLNLTGCSPEASQAVIDHALDEIFAAPETVSEAPAATDGSDTKGTNESEEEEEEDEPQDPVEIEKHLTTLYLLNSQQISMLCSTSPTTYRVDGSHFMVKAMENEDKESPLGSSHCHDFMAYLLAKEGNQDSEAVADLTLMWETKEAYKKGQKTVQVKSYFVDDIMPTTTMENIKPTGHELAFTLNSAMTRYFEFIKAARKKEGHGHKD